MDKVVIKSDHVVQIRLKSPSNQVLNELTQVRPLRIMSPHSVENGKVNGKFEKRLEQVPLSLINWQRKTTMKPNKYFNHSHPVNYNLAFQTIEDGDSRNSAVQSGSVDISGGALGMLSISKLSKTRKIKT